MNNPIIIIISRRILKTTTDIDAPAAAVSPDDPSKPFDKTLIILLSVTAFLCVTFFVAPFVYNLICNSRSEADSPPSRRLSGKSLPLIPYAEDRMIDDCPICLTEFRQDEAVKLIPYCSHVFHPTCLDTWLASHVTCPLCRSAELSLDVPPDNCAAAAERSM